MQLYLLRRFQGIDLLRLLLLKRSQSKSVGKSWGRPLETQFTRRLNYH